MRGLTALFAAAAAWSLTGLPLPALTLRPLRLPHLAVLAGSCGAGTAAFLGAASLGGSRPVAGALAGLGFVVPISLDVARRRRAVEAAAGRWPDFLAALRGRLAAGEALPEATAAAAAGGGERLESLRRRLAEGRVAGRSYAAVLAAAREDWRDPLADRVLITLAAAAGIGGERVGEVLSRLAASVADELRLRRAHEAALTEQRLTAAVALGAPWALLLLTTATNPQAAAAYSASAGTWVVGVGLAATALGFWLARRVARLSEMPRVFT